MGLHLNKTCTYCPTRVIYAESKNEIGYGIYSKNPMILVLPNQAEISIVSLLFGFNTTPDPF
jgi:hypothetical protein